MSDNPLFVSKEGGTIDCFRGDSGYIFRVCSDRLSLYCNDLITAKLQLARLEKLRKYSTKLSLELLKRNGETLRKLLETSAAPYLNNEITKHIDITT